MRRIAAQHSQGLMALSLLGVLAGCGNFSNEDLIFLSALPGRDSVALKVPGADYGQQRQGLSAQTQGLTACAEDDLRCLAGRVSTGINAGVFAVLDLVDNIAFNQQPTRREPGLRLWGPVYLPAQNLSLRFEIRRHLDADRDAFEYCLHGLRGEADLDLAADLDCSSAVDDSGLVRVLHGQFVPDGEGGGARAGSGTLSFDLNAARDAGLGKPTDQGRIAVVYAHEGEALSITLQIREVIDQQTLLPAEADYAYLEQGDGSGQFRFAVRAEFVGGFLLSTLEQLEIGAQWTVEEAGRADATISGGDLGSSVITATQCWDAQLATVFYGDSAVEHPDQGIESACAFGAPLP